MVKVNFTSGWPTCVFRLIIDLIREGKMRNKKRNQDWGLFTAGLRFALSKFHSERVWFYSTNFSFAPVAGPVKRGELIATVRVEAGDVDLSSAQRSWQAANLTATYRVPHTTLVDKFRRCCWFTHRHTHDASHLYHLWLFIGFLTAWQNKTVVSWRQFCSYRRHGQDKTDSFVLSLSTIRWCKQAINMLVVLCLRPP